jgi:hypothetical protein
MASELAAPLRGRLDGFRAAFPDFAFNSIHCHGRSRIEAVRTGGRTALYAVITDDPDELRSILAHACRDADSRA